MRRTWWAPITATVLAGHLAASVARRLRVSAPVVAAAGVVAVVLATVWGQLLSATRDGIPTIADVADARVGVRRGRAP